MIAILKRGDNPIRMNALLKKLKERVPNKGIDVKKYCGVIKLKDDALNIQRRLRDEWD